MERARPAPRDAGDERRIPRVIRNALDGAREPRPPHASAAGYYSPAVPLQMALAHRWARYGDVVSALRNLANLSLIEEPACECARLLIERLLQHPAPFDASTRFPEAEVFLAVDDGNFGQRVRRIQKEMLHVEAGIRGVDWQCVSSACVAFMEAISSAAGTATLVFPPEEPGKPVLFDRTVFEEAFHLTWTETDA